VITGGRNARDSLYTITYRNRDRDKALAVVRSLVDTFVESTRGQKLVATDSAERFLLARKEDYEHRLTEAENKLAEFRRTNMGLLPGEHRDYFARLQEQLDLRSVAQRGLEQAQSERRQIQEQLAGEKPVTAVPGANPSDVAPGQPGYTRSSIDRRIQEAEDQLSQMRTRWTDKHPAIVAQREQIEELRAEKQRYLKALGVAGLTDSPVSIESNPVYQSLRMALSQVELKIFQLTAEISTRNTTIAELERFADTLPRVEADYQQLNRDYNVINAQYQEVVRRLETARLSGEADQSEDVDFRTIEPATADSQPVAPKRLLLLPGVFFGALAIGIWAAVMRSHLTPVLYTVQDVTRVSGLPVLGLVSRASTDGRRVSIRGRVFRFAGASVVFGFVFLLVLVLGIADSAWLSALRAHLS
jgi:polysaccharide chain length determinant protein (PEP-CTERM system associated)